MDKMRQKNISNLQTGEAVQYSVANLAFNVSKAKIHFNVEQGFVNVQFHEAVLQSAIKLVCA